jgi:hypothetical protein
MVLCFEVVREPKDRTSVGLGGQTLYMYGSSCSGPVQWSEWSPSRQFNIVAVQPASQQP